MIDQELMEQIIQHPYEIRQIDNKVFIESPLFIVPEFIGITCKKVTKLIFNEEGIYFYE